MITPQCLAEIDPHAIGISLIVLASVSPLILAAILHYLKKRLDHRQIMAAIEKGVPLSEIMPLKPQPVGPAWIRYAAIGVALLVIGFGTFMCGGIGRNPGILIAVIVIGAGAGWLTRGVLHRKYYLQDKAAEETSKAEK